MKSTITIFFVCAFFSCANTFAQGVVLKTGAMYISYEDVSFEEDTTVGLRLERTYDSKEPRKGWFGIGWTTNFQNRLLVIPGGGVASFLWGSSGASVYHPRQWNKQEIADKVNILADQALKELEVTNTEEVAKLKNELWNDEQARIRRWDQYLSSHPTGNLLLPFGTKLISDYNMDSYLEVTKDGYKIYLEDDSYQIFDFIGRIKKIVDSKGYEISIYYNDGVLPTLIKDNLGNSMNLNFKESLLQSVDVLTSKGKKEKCFYEYDFEKGILINSTDVELNQYTYEYDNNYNMTAIRYSDGKSATITYDPYSHLVTSIKPKDGSRRTFEFPEKNDNEYGTVVTSFDSLGVQIKKESIWYVYKTNDLGFNWQHKFISVLNGDSTTYVNNELTVDTIYRNNGLFYTYKYTKKTQLREIFQNSKLLVTVESQNKLLTKIKSAKYNYTVIYKDGIVASLKAEDGTEISLPIDGVEVDKKGYKADITSFLEAFKYTVYSEDLQT